jgi:hypothetical protein
MTPPMMGYDSQCFGPPTGLKNDFSWESMQRENYFHDILDQNISHFMKVTQKRVDFYKDERDFVFNKIRSEAISVFKG